MRLKRLILLSLTVVSVLMTMPHLVPPRVAGAPPAFNSPQLVDLLQGQDDSPSTLQLSNGTLWVAWQHWFDLGYFVTFSSAAGWSSPQLLPTQLPGANFTVTPGLGQLSNSSIILVWSSNATGRFNLYYRFYSFHQWTNPVQLTSGILFNDYYPRIVTARDSTVWVFWQRDLTTSNSTLVYYKTLKGSAWSSDTQLSPAPPPNGIGDTIPGPITTYDGKIWITWSRSITRTTSAILYRSFSATGWSPEIQLTGNNTRDLSPSFSQDRNGTLWNFWSRQMFLGTDPICNCAVYQDKLWYKFSYDGNSWSPDTQLTSYGNLTTPMDDDGASVVQAFDKSLYIFYSSDYPLGGEFKIYYIKTNPITPVHNVVITQIQAGPYAFQNSFATVLVTISDRGDYPEIVYLTVRAVNLTLSWPIATSAAENINPGATRTFAFVWNTTLVPLRIYTITASYPRLGGQTLIASGGDQMQYKSLTLFPPITPVKCRFAFCPV